MHESFKGVGAERRDGAHRVRLLSAALRAGMRCSPETWSKYPPPPSPPVHCSAGRAQNSVPKRKEEKKKNTKRKDADEAKEAQENGAAFAGGVELIQPILDDEISADFYVAVPDILQKLLPLKNKLRKKFPKSKRGSVGIHIPKMLQLFKTGHEYMVESECYVRTQIATLDMPREHIFSNLQTILLDVCSHRPADMGPFIERAIIASQTSEALWYKSEDLLPKPAEEKTE
ncbi:39S ribosomal protein L1, mitochondrial [Collichthys lucidus]|uniref:39S ribosomal protein L1, mitochondrial n=1 Tax=Collichthys lucidus TaxID=240159 RepID=A0A4U5UT42_COLLU|nr:39S ribosomal protein L1, mitochondrial [Collichthys lucidus]